MAEAGLLASHIVDIVGGGVELVRQGKDRSNTDARVEIWRDSSQGDDEQLQILLIVTPLRESVRTGYIGHCTRTFWGSKSESRGWGQSTFVPSFESLRRDATFSPVCMTVAYTATSRI